MLGWSLSPGKAVEQHEPCWRGCGTLPQLLVAKNLLSLEWPWLYPKLVSGVDTARTKGSPWTKATPRQLSALLEIAPVNFNMEPAARWHINKKCELLTLTLPHMKTDLER